MTSLLAWPAGYAHSHFGTIDSTNEEARRLAASGFEGAVWISADTQTAGRGRRGRSWESPTGNLAATLLINPGRPISECAQLSFVAALSACDAVASYAPSRDIRVKWPNDVLAEGRKIAGILLESASHGPSPEWLAIGVGINLAHHPEGTAFPATSLKALEVSVPSAADMLVQLAARFAKWYESWRELGFGPIRDAWLARAAMLGGQIVARLTHEETGGVFEGIDETGALLLREKSGRLRSITAGEVFF